MDGRSRLLALALTTFTAATFATAARAQDAQLVVDDGTREWNQERGGPRCDAANDVAPIARRPVEAWRFGLERVLAEPVCWGGVVYVLGEHQGKSRLVALDLESGRVLGPSHELDGARPAHLAAWRGFVAIARPGALTFVAFQGERFVANGPAHAGGWPSAPTACGRHLFACDGAGALVVFDLETGTEIARGSARAGQPCVVPLPTPGDVRVATLVAGERPPPDPDHYYPGTWLGLEERNVRRLGLVPVRVDEPRVVWLGDCADAQANAQMLANSTTSLLARRTAPAESVWAVRSDARVTVKDKGPMSTVLGDGRRLPVETSAAHTQLDAWGFDGAGKLVRFEATGEYWFVLDTERQPAGARRGPVTLARRVLYAPNWAFDLDARATLWIDAKLDPRSALLPVADRRALYVSRADEIVMLREPEEMRAAVTNSAPATLPGSGEGVVLADGRRVAGAVNVDGGRVTVKDAAGRETFHVAAEVALVETQRRVKKFGDEAPVLRACWRYHAERLASGLAALCARYSDKDFVDDGLRVTRDLAALGHDPEKVRQLERLFAGRRTNRSEIARILRTPIAEKEDELRKEALAGIRASAEWLRDQDLDAAASALLARSRTILPAEPRALELARSLVPAGWPRASDADALARWEALVDALLPSGGTLLAPADPQRALVPAEAARGATLFVASRNLLLASRCEDPNAIGTILVDGERALRQLDRLFGDAKTRSKAAARRLPTLIYEDAQTYHAASPLGQDLEWASGHFDSRAGTSSFYVEWSRDDGPRRMTSRGVVAHELTHHWLATRWAGADGRAALIFDKTPGFWAIEGVATFVEEQVERMDTRGERLDDDSVDSIDLAARARDAGCAFELAKLLQITGPEQHALDTRAEFEVTSKRSGGKRKLSRMNVFYAQSGSLAYFLVHHPRRPRHAELAQYLRAVYSNQLDANGWTVLGWTDLDELQREFNAFLAAH